MRLPKTSRSYAAETEELFVGRGDYVIGGSRSPAFLDLDNCRHRRPVVYGEVYDTLEGYPESAAGMFSGRQNDPEEWAVMWKELGADGVCLRLSEDSVPLAKNIVSRTGIPLMVFGETETLKKIASDITGTVIILGSEDEEQSLELSKYSNNHIVMATASDDAASLCRRMTENGAKNVIVNLGDAVMDPSLKSLRARMEEYRMNGLNGVPDSRHTIACRVSGTWDSHDEDVSARRASMMEATTALSVMLSGADVLIVKGPGAADMARVYGEELADL